ncbi:bifunctional UDP-sugar hydrolase/5'-nucleotidase periplasmic precursor [Salmonella enterica subsp. enterica]|uniref:Bifunctional UDP-sugar hydrolase/5'-nucleotidase periplasmic n=1 Tax=Salmonella enterica I TaxID=59201 RepID=A0A3S4HZ14_SALET|nr:bifunctional UDP-sugar hydrolase/5'-nucleotidase periplasmic precursor [Salmonella enterica subsp. enterica]
MSQGEKDEIFETGVWRWRYWRRFALTTQPAQAYEKDKTYKITILHTNDHHGHFWRSEYGEYGLAAQKTLVDSIRKEVAPRGGKRPVVIRRRH